MNEKIIDKQKNLPQYDVVLFYGRLGKTDFYFREHELTLQSLSDYIERLPKENKKGKKLKEVSLPIEAYKQIVTDVTLKLHGVEIISQ